MLGALMGRRAVSLSTLGRATTAARGVGRSAKETEDVAKAQARLQEAQSEARRARAELQQEVAALEGAAPGGVALETIEIKPSEAAWTSGSSRSPGSRSPRKRIESYDVVALLHANRFWNTRVVMSTP
jgi:hypothetical protein